MLPAAPPIPSYNAECRKIVTRYTNEWKEIVSRLGRWIDFDHGYKTMEPWYMESEWWAFKTLYEKGLVYRGYRVMPFSTACTTPLSNFEANLNYKDVSDPAIIISFKCKDDESTALPSPSIRRLRLPRLDHHPLDPAFQPRPGRPPRVRVRQDPRQRPGQELDRRQVPPPRPLPQDGEEGLQGYASGSCPHP